MLEDKLLRLLKKWNDNLIQRVLTIALLTILFLMGIYFVMNRQQPSKETSFETSFPSSRTDITKDEKERNVKREIEVKSDDILVDVKGAIKNPGVYHLNSESRVQDAIVKAGGFADDADPNAINLAQKLKDEGIVYVATRGENKSITDISVSKSEERSVSDNKKVNLNRANQEDLTKIPGVGPKKAQEIIAERDKLGGFKKIEDLLNISGIGQKTLDKIKDDITVN